MRLNITCPGDVDGSLMFKFGGSKTFTTSASTGNYNLAITIASYTAIYVCMHIAIYMYAYSYICMHIAIYVCI